MKKVALITGITGMDGSHLSEILIDKGYNVYGLVRRVSTDNKERLQHIKKEVTLYYGDITDSNSIMNIIRKCKPDEIYHLAALSHVQVSFEVPVYASNVDAIGTLNLLEAVRIINPKIKIYNATTSELFGKTNTKSQNESTPFNPQSPYGVAKLFSFHIAKLYRDAYGMFISNGLLFNHEGPRRSEKFVSRKITKEIAEIMMGRRNKIILGNLDAKRDFGYAPDYVLAMWMMLQQDKPDDFVISTGETHSVREFVEVAFKEVGINIIWKGKGIKEKGINKSSGKVIVEVSKNYFRPLDVDYLLGDYSKAKEVLGWKPTVKFNELVKLMVKYDLDNIC